MNTSAGCRVLALCGGVGGAKLCLGLDRALPRGHLTVVVNGGDDFDHLGLRICPDLDTVMYTMSGLANPELGWGRRDETWSFMETLEALGGETWFRLGDRDLALHAERSRRLANGETLSAICTGIASSLDIASQVLPMSDDSVRTMVGTPDGELSFQHYFVRERCVPKVTSLRFAGAEQAKPAEAVLRALASPALEAIVIAPSNPYLSIDPILALPGLRAGLRARGVPIVAVTPLIGGEAVKGPTAKIMRELGIEPTPLAVARHYGGLIDGFVLDERDTELASGFELPVHICNTWMKTIEDREALATATLAFAASLEGAREAAA